jgi:ribosomal protein S12 methylthiotransferase accessory factor
MTAWYASAFTGLFTRFGPLPPRPYDPPLALCSGAPAAWAGPAPGAEASGIGWDAAEAEAACAGEAIERLQAYPLPDDQAIEASYDAWPLAEPAVPPDRWVLFHPEQYRQPGFPFAPLTGATLCPWVCCRQAGTGLPWWVPAELAYLNLPPGVVHRLCPGLSTGLACGRDGDPLVLRGLQEVVERDAIVGAWWGLYPLEEFPAGVVLDGLGPQWRENLTRPNLRYRCFRVGSPFSRHVTLVTLEGEDREGYCFSVGSACRETAAASWAKSLLEAIHCRHYVRYLKRQAADGAGPWPASFRDHAMYYSTHPERLAATVLASVHPPGDDAFPAAREDVADLSGRLGPDRPVLFRSMTPPGLAVEGLGWHVVRVVVPGLQPLHGDHRFPHLGGGLWSPRGLAEWAAMPPHPFP